MLEKWKKTLKKIFQNEYYWHIGWYASSRGWSIPGIVGHVAFLAPIHQMPVADSNRWD